MFQIGETVVYGTTGVCTITSLGPLSMHGVDRKREYYTLQPLHQDGSVYVPAEGEKLKAMRYPLTAAEAEAFFRQIPSLPPCEIQHFNYKQRTDAFNDALHENRCESLVGIIKAVQLRKLRYREKQKYNVDNNYMKRAMGLLCGELAFSLGESMDQVRQRVEAALRAAPIPRPGCEQEETTEVAM